MQMPMLKPLPIQTQGKPFWEKVWLVLTAARKWEVVEDWVYFLPCGTPVIIPKGFVMDGASTPKFMWGILDPVGVLLIPGIIHDYGYRYDYLWAVDKKGKLYKYHCKKGRAFWDRLFLDVEIHANDLHLTGVLSYIMLRIFGVLAWNSNRKLNDPALRPQ